MIKKVAQKTALTKLLMMLILPIIILLSMNVSLAATQNDRFSPNNYDTSLIDMNSWTWHTENWGYVWNTLWLRNMYTQRGTNDAEYLKSNFWLPIQPWEFQVCSQGLSSQLTDDNHAESGGSGIYDTAMTIAAYKRIPVRLNDTLLYEVTWYFQPMMTGDHGQYYEVELTGPGGKKVLQEKKGVSRQDGDYGYLAWYDAENYTDAVINYGLLTLDKKFTTKIINVTDINR